ncbi:MAG: hypothetical protein LPD71_12400 [Shewanella sp.]|nr:hypothetical protein [Shewanella sp.]MCF1439503.1 hypothetical protein [Shewanella sp.]
MVLFLCGFSTNLAARDLADIKEEGEGRSKFCVRLLNIQHVIQTPFKKYGEL